MTQTTHQAEDDALRFRQQFHSLTGNLPMRWQERLFCQHFDKNDVPEVIDLPTGLGKTMVMAIWLIARASNPSLPRRLVYVVDRRTVVDQTTDLALRLQLRIRAIHRLARSRCQLKPYCDSFPIPAISTLRGRLADNRDWTRDPSRPAIIIGTVDMIGSRLLFSGYRSSYKQRPLDAGLLGQDSLLVLDEAHLSKPFEKLIGAVGEGGTFQRTSEGMPSQPMRVIRMSATSAADLSDRDFRLEGDFEKQTGDFDDEITCDRYKAAKRLTIRTLGEKDDLNTKLADEAIKLAQKSDLCGKRIVVFVRSPENAKSIAEKIRQHGKPKAKSNADSKGPYADSVAILTGTIRGLERDQLAEKAVFKERWLNGKLDPADTTNQEPVFLVSTSAGEVGFDLNADHMVCDATTIDSLIQRLGRVNRRGNGTATVVLVREPEKKIKDGKPVALQGLDLAIANTLKLLDDAKDDSGSVDVSPKNIAALKSGKWKEKYAAACSPEIPTVELTDILLDAWSMTSITQRMPGRPEVGPWLRGIAKEQAEASIAWRAEPELLRKHPNAAKALQAVFAKHRIRPHECLTTYSHRVVEFLKEAVKPKGGRPDLGDASLVIRLPRGEVIIHTVQQLIDDSDVLYAEPTLILPATFGGLDEAGMLSAKAIPAAPKEAEPPLPSLDVADHPDYEQHNDATPRLRLVIRRTDEGNWVPESLPGGSRISDRLVLKESYDSSTALFAGLRNARKANREEAHLRIRLVQPIEINDEGDAVRSLVMLAPVANKTKPEDQSLACHVKAVEEAAEVIANRLDLKGPFRDALLFAARWHDEGKKADIWQRFVDRKADEEYKGKSAKTRDPKSLRGYRHEFGSLMRLQHPGRHQTGCLLPTDADTRDLALHLIATHHGFGRPHFTNAVDRDFRTIDCAAVHADSIRRFARLQRKYGWWRLAWLENLLRCADALASADDVSEDDVGEANEETGENP